MPENYIARHADKGQWNFDLGELKELHIPQDKINLLTTTLGELRIEQSPLTKEGLVRSIALGDAMFGKVLENSDFISAGNRGVVATMDSGSDRAHLTREIAVNRVSQLESRQNKVAKDSCQIDMLELDCDELMGLLKDTDPRGWDFYKKMIEDDGISEFEALFRYFRDMNNGQNLEFSPQEGALRYKKFIQEIRSRIKLGESPLFIFSVGHAGPLGQIKHEHMGDMGLDDVPQFCELFEFNDRGELSATEKVEI